MLSLRIALLGGAMWGVRRGQKREETSESGRGAEKEATEKTPLGNRVQYGRPVHLFYKRAVNGIAAFLSYRPSHEILSQ